MNEYSRQAEVIENECAQCVLHVHWTVVSCCLSDVCGIID